MTNGHQHQSRLQTRELVAEILEKLDRTDERLDAIHQRVITLTNEFREFVERQSEGQNARAARREVA
jgi:division protein CdvB (Snf7/Vps24/ESCRT-III family)